uniref:Short chain dehydrogenase/reductase family 42E, member 2 n=1 Tax=Myotis myotis TaxID=51298 RepID=A0A7J7Y1W2_MYOMY|nr:short chain dehydrogenase/reductase family 42E, member 2 [Myotis myotis]
METGGRRLSLRRAAREPDQHAGPFKLAREVASRPTPTPVPPSAARLSPQVHSVAVTHTFRIGKARAQLGYAPDKFNFADAVERYVQTTARRPRGPRARALLRLLLGLLLLVGLLAAALHFLRLQPSVV